MRRALYLLFVVAVAASAAGAQQLPIDPARAATYFAEARRRSDADGGRMWGVPLCGPMLFVDAQSRDVVANQADAEGKLTHTGDVWTGKLPSEVGAANTAVQWAGVHWTMIMWPLPLYRRDRMALMMHECFHRVQDRLGLPARDEQNNHLDTRDGRIWLQLEWRALERALETSGPAQRAAVADALLFRAWRRALFPGAAASENALEMNEGLAEYTGERLANTTAAELRVAAIVGIREAGGRRTFVRSFAYMSGPAYGALLSGAPAPRAAWRKGLKPDSDFGALLARAYRITLAKPAEAAVLAQARFYDGDEIIAIETERDRKRQAAVAAARARFVDGPVLILPASEGFRYAFDPNGVMALDDNLSIYTPANLSDDWGVLECEKGALIVREKGLPVRAQVPAPADPAARPLKLDGCTLELHAGWTTTGGARSGDWIVTHSRP
jgi:hypothetical protein